MHHNLSACALFCHISFANIINAIIFLNRWYYSGCGLRYGRHFHTGYGMWYGMFIVIQCAMTKLGSNHTPYHTAYTSVYIAKYGVWYLAECMHWNAKKSVVNHFKNPIEAMVMKEKRLLQITLSLFDWGERSSQSYDKSTVLPYGSCSRVVLPFILYAKQWRMK